MAGYQMINITTAKF